MLDVTRAYGLNFLYPLNDDTIGASLRDYGEFSKVEVDLIAAYMELSEAGAFVDVGANVGAVCLPVAKRFPDRQVVAVEGHPGLAQIAGTNAFANGLYNAEVIHAVAGPMPGLTRFPSVSLATRGNFGSLGVKDVGQGGREANVRMCTLDEIAPEDVAVVKLDVEGFEPSVLAGAQRVLHQTRPVWIIEAAREMEASARKTISLMMAAGYDVYWLVVPFVTRTGTKRGAFPAEIKGDVNILAAPAGGPDLWGLPRVAGADAPFPSKPADMPHFERFGFGTPPG